MQVFSSTVSCALLQMCGDKASETAHFVGLVDKFFDTINVHKYTHGHKTVKPAICVCK